MAMINLWRIVLVLSFKQIAVHSRNQVSLVNIAPCCLSTNLLTDDEVTKCYHPVSLYETPTVKTAPNITYFIQSSEHVIVKSNGDLTIRDSSNKDLYFDLDQGSYCVGITNESGTIEHVLVIWMDEELGIDAVTSGWLHVVSAPFLFFTALVYGLIPQLRDLQGKSFICFCTVFAMELSILAWIKLRSQEAGSFVTVRAFFLYFLVISRFLWSNVISIQIYKNVRNYQEKIDPHGLDFLWYSFYAWGVTTLCLACVMIANYTIKGPFAPSFHNGWFESRESNWTYLYGPIAVIVLINFLIFLYASMLLWQTTFVGSNIIKSLKFKFSMCLRLMLVTNVTWIFEVFNFAFGKFHPFWVVTDILNCLQGFLIFIILIIMRKRAIEGLYRRGFCCLCEPIIEKHLAKIQDDEDLDMISHTVAVPLEDQH